MSRYSVSAAWFVATCSLLSLFSSSSTLALEASGTTVAVLQSAAASGATGSRILELEAPVYMGDRIKTGSVGEAQLRFRDQTRLVVGANSSLLIDNFVFNDNNTASQVGMRAVRGTFRFITGVSNKQAYSISTPTMTIGVRGTRFDFTVAPNGETSFALFEGGARLCDRARRCVEVTGRCAVVVSPPGSRIQQLEAGPDRAARLRAAFPYIQSQSRLLPDFRVDTSSCSIQRADYEMRDPLVPPGALAVAPVIEPPAPPPSPPPTSGGGNPGNGKPVGGAGENPGRGGFGGGSHGKGDTHGRRR